MEFNFKGIDEEEKEAIPILPSWAYSKEEIINLLDQYVNNAILFKLET